MPAKHLFEYAVLRLVPRVEREEFINVGVILYCGSQGFLQATCTTDDLRLQAFAGPGLDLEDVRARLAAIGRVCQGRVGGGPIGQLPIASRFRWLTAQRSTIIQTSPVHPGLCEDAAATLARLHTALVG